MNPSWRPLNSKLKEQIRATKSPFQVVLSDWGFLRRKEPPWKISFSRHYSANGGNVPQAHHVAQDRIEQNKKCREVTNFLRSLPHAAKVPAMNEATLCLFSEAKIARRDIEKKRLKWAEEAHAFWESQYAEHGDDFSRQMMEAMFDLRSSQHGLLEYFGRYGTMVAPPVRLMFPPTFRA